MKYTIVCPSGEALEHGLTLEEAAKELLWYDGHKYELRKDSRNAGWAIWRTNKLGEMSETIFYSACEDENAAWRELAERVVAQWGGEGWRNEPEAMTDDQWDKLQAEAAEWDE